MIAKEFETFLLGQEETFLTPAENLAVLIDTHNCRSRDTLAQSDDLYPCSRCDR